MEVPEIQLHVAEHLDTFDLYACALVCKAWNATFTPRLYHVLDQVDTHIPSHGRNATHVRKIRLPMFDTSIEQIPVGTCHLVQELEVIRDGGDSIPPLWLALLQQNPRLVKLTTQKMTPGLLVNILSVCPSIQELVVRNHPFWGPSLFLSAVDWPAFWRICQRLTQLELFSSIPEYPEGIVRGTLPSMQHLTVDVPDDNAWKQMELISACNNLETLKWRFRLTGMDIHRMGPEVFQRLFQALPRLRAPLIYIQMTFPSGSFDESWTRRFLAAFPLLRGFQDPRSRMHDITTGLVQESLSRHFSTLEVLNLGGWKELTSEDNHLILTSCPRLEMFISNGYRIGQIASLKEVTLSSGDCSESEHGPLGWVCTRLSSLSLHFVHETPEKSRLMFDQLCHMKRLETVRLQSEASGLDPALIQWDDKVPARHWCSTVSRYAGLAPEPWMRTIWPGIHHFSSYSS